MKRAIQTILTIPLIVLAWYSLPAADTGPFPRSTGAAVLLADNGAATQQDPGVSADIMIPDPLFTFDPVIDGTEVVHDFRVYNRGTGQLAIEKVQTG